MSDATLADRALQYGAGAAADYIRVNFPAIRPDVVHYGDAARIVIEEVQAALPAAMLDVREAFAVRMFDIGTATFAASMRLAGIKAGKRIAEQLVS